MNRYKGLFLLLLLPWCAIKSQNELKSGRLINNFQFFDTATGQPGISMRTSIWYKDSLAIEEIIVTKINTDTNHKTTIDCEVMHYVFIDLKTGFFYQYAHFSDTAKLMSSYRSLKDAKSPQWLWDFRYNKRAKPIKPLQVLPDTVIAGIVYQRQKWINDIGKGPYATIKYLRCDLKGLLITLQKEVGDDSPCPVVISHNQNKKGTRPENGAHLEFISDKLSEEELSVFDAWEKYAKQHPVQ